MPRNSWRNQPEYQFTEDNANPQFRPSVDKLISQLRRHKALKEHPDAVAFVIKDLSHRFLVRDDQRPDLLWQVIADLTYQFQHLMPAGKKGFEDWVEEQMDQNSQGQTLLRTEKWPYARVATEEEQATIDSAGGLEVVSEHSEPVMEVTPAGDSPVIRYTPKNWDVNFDDNDLKEGVAGVIVRHRGMELVNRSMRCRCKRFYDTPEDWANHVRVRIWRFFKNEFPAIPSPDEEHGSRTDSGRTGEAEEASS